MYGKAKYSDKYPGNNQSGYIVRSTRNYDRIIKGRVSVPLTILLLEFLLTPLPLGNTEKALQGEIT